MNWLLEKLGILNAYERILVLEQKISKMEREIDGLKMEADILYANSLEKEGRFSIQGYKNTITIY